MNPITQAKSEWFEVDHRVFNEEIIPRHKPAVLRGFVKHWPAVQHGLASAEAICAYLKSFDNGTQVNAIMTRPEEQGRVFYNEGMNGFNFLRNKLSISAIIDQLSRYLDGKNPPCLAAQSAKIPECLPGFEKENQLPVLDPDIAPRIWIGNTITVPAHVDDANNIACVISGKRRFTLFPPDQVENLYIGPLDYNPAGAPISMVRAHDPDLKRFPNYPKALEKAQVFELLPGDALYIPPVWWHQVESIGKLNILVNYWWGGSLGSTDKTNGPIECLMHCLLNMKDLPIETRAAWGSLFNHYIFHAQPNQFDYIPENRQGVLGKLSDDQIEAIKSGLIQKLRD